MGDWIDDPNLSFSEKVMRFNTLTTATIADVEPLPNYRAQAIAYAAALREIIATLGPDVVCESDECGHPDGLVVEAAEALRIARDALGTNPTT